MRVKIPQRFSLCVQRFDMRPGQFASRYEYRILPQVVDARSRPTISVKWDAWPTGTGKLVGRIHDQYQRPLKEYYLTLARRIGEQHDWSGSNEYAIETPVMDAQGRYEVGELPPGAYTVMVRHFDYPAYAWSFDGPKVTIPDAPGAVVHFAMEVEAKELFYGRAVYQDGKPVSSGGWTARFSHDPTSASGGKNFSLGIEKDGVFRVPLSREGALNNWKPIPRG